MTPLHEKLAEIVPGVLSARDGSSTLGAMPSTPRSGLSTPAHPSLAAVEDHAAAGCSRCARALVNAGDAAVVLAEGEAASGGPSPALRQRVLAAAGLASRHGASRWEAPRPQPPRRFFDPAGEVARLHVGAPGDAERIREIDALAASDHHRGEAMRRYLAQVQALLGFPLLFVSIVRGERVGYCAQIGYDGGPGSPVDRRRETTFCTHTVSCDVPMVVPNAAAEPFFRASHMVRRDGVQAYAGVPLRTSRGVVVGTLCVMDFVPRRIEKETVQVLELFTEPVAAELERARRDAWPRTAAGAPLHPEGWFRKLVEAVTAPCLFVVASGPGAEVLADVALEGEPVGRLGREGASSRDGPVGLLLAPSSGWAGRAPRAASGASPAERFVEIRDALRDRLARESRGGGVDVALVERVAVIANYFR